MNTDNLRAAIIAVIQSLLPVLQILGIVSFTGDEVATIMLFVTNIVTLLFLVFKPGSTGAVIAAAGLIAAFGLLGTSSPRVASAAVDCGIASPTGVRIEVIDLDAEDEGTRIDHAGAMVKFQPDPLDGAGTRIIRDNGALDDSPLVGRIEVEEACAGEYTLELSFDAALFECDIADDETVATNLEGDAVATFEVDDCAVTPTPTPTSTPATPTATVTPAATSTPTPAATATPTQAPVFVPVPVVQTVTVERIVEVPVIRPPNTGDGGLATYQVGGIR